MKSRIGSDEIEKIKGEADMLNSLEHPHIVKLKHVFLWIFSALA